MKFKTLWVVFVAKHGFTWSCLPLAMVSEASLVKPLFNTKGSPCLCGWRDKTSGRRTTLWSQCSLTLGRQFYTVLVTCLHVATVSGSLSPYHTIAIATYVHYTYSFCVHLIAQLHVAMCDRFSLCHPQATPNHSPNAIPFLPPSPSS